MNNNEITKELSVLEPSKAKQIESIFNPMVEMLKEFEGQYNNIVSQEITPELCVNAKRLRLGISRIRIDADKVRKEQKEQYLRAGNAIQGVYNILKFAVVDKEEKLKDIETYYEKIEQEKLKALQAERELELSKYDVDGSTIDLANMDESIWNNFLGGSKSNYDAIKEAEKKVEEEKLENEEKKNLYEARLKSLLIYGDLFDTSLLTIDATEKDFDSIIFKTKALKVEKDKHLAQIKADNEKLRLEKEKADKEKEKQDAILKKERLEREALENKIKEEKELAEKSRIEKEKIALEEKKKLELAPDKEKLLDIIKYLSNQLDIVKSDVAKLAITKAKDILYNTSKEL